MISTNRAIGCRHQRTMVVRHRMMQKSEINTKERQLETVATFLFKKKTKKKQLMSGSPKPLVHTPHP